MDFDSDNSDRWADESIPEARVSAFEDLFFKNPETCSQCYRRIRNIGEEVEVTTSLHRHRVNRYYERTEDGARAYHPGAPPSKRYADTLCEHCGSDGRAWVEDRGLNDLLPVAKRLLVRTARETPYDIDGETMGRELRELKAKDYLQGYDTEILALAWARATTTADHTTTSAPA